MPRCTAVLTTELPGRAFARILRTPVPHCESCFPLLLEPHLVVPRPGGTGGRWQGTAQGHASSRRSRPLSPADDQDTRGTHHPLPALHPPNPSPAAPCPSPPAQSWALPHSHGSCPGVLGESARLAAPPGPPWVSVLLALLSHQEPDREEQRVESGGSPQPSSSLWGH